MKNHPWTLHLPLPETLLRVEVGCTSSTAVLPSDLSPLISPSCTEVFSFLLSWRGLRCSSQGMGECLLQDNVSPLWYKSFNVEPLLSVFSDLFWDSFHS